MTPHECDEITARDVLEWRRVKTPTIRVRTDRDAIPGGLSLAGDGRSVVTVRSDEQADIWMLGAPDPTP